MTRVLVRLLVCLFIMSADAAFAQRPGRLTPAHLSEMPTVDRVVRTITGATAQDTAARQMGAFEQLNEIIAELSGGRLAVGQATPDERRIMEEYGIARMAAMNTVYRGPQDDALLPVLRRYDEDPALREEMVRAFFSPALQTQVTAMGRELQARRAAMRQREAANGGVPEAFGGAAARPQPTGPTPPAGTAAPATAAPGRPDPARPPDPSVAKARAAGVDTKVFGLQLGDPLSVPECGLMGLLNAQLTCTMGSDAMGIATALISAAGGVDLGNLTMLRVGAGNCPAWVTDCQALASLDGGALVAVTITTPGRDVEAAVARELRAKYGTPSSSKVGQIAPDVGNPFTVTSLEWRLPGLHVLFEPVARSSDSTRVKTYEGVVIIETERAYQIRSTREAEIARPKL